MSTDPVSRARGWRIPFAAVAMFAAAVPTLGFSIRYVPVVERVAEADAVILGQVVALDPRRVSAEEEGGGRVELTIAQLRVHETLLGDPAPGTARVAFRSDDYFPIPSPRLRVGQEVCLFLHRQAGLDPWRILGHFGAVGRPAAIAPQDDFAETVAATRHAVALLQNPAAGLGAADPVDRTLTAWMLVIRHRRPSDLRPDLPEEPLGPVESRLILENLMPLAERDPDALWQLFDLLGLEPWHLVGKVDDFPAVARRWLREHAATHRLTRRVPRP